LAVTVVVSASSTLPLERKRLLNKLTTPEKTPVVAVTPPAKVAAPESTNEVQETGPLVGVFVIVLVKVSVAVFVAVLVAVFVAVCVGV
jgi:hypothetical protein